MAFYDSDVDVMIDEQTLQAAQCASWAREITSDYQGKELTLVGIMKGSLFFVTDLARAIDLPLTLEFMGVLLATRAAPRRPARCASPTTCPSR